MSEGAGPPRGWATLTLICGLATLAVAAAFGVVAAPTYATGELSGAVSAFQRAADADAVTRLFADNRMARLEAMNAVNRLDLNFFIGAYTLFLISAAAWQARGLRLLMWLAIAAALVAALGDVVETRTQLALADAWIEAGAPHFLPEAAAAHLPIAPWHWLKYFALGACSVAIGLMALLATPRRWIVGVLSFTPIFGALAVFVGLADDGRLLTAPLAALWTVLLVLAARDAVLVKKKR